MTARLEPMERRYGRSAFGLVMPVPPVGMDRRGRRSLHKVLPERTSGNLPGPTDFVEMPSPFARHQGVAAHVRPREMRTSCQLLGIHPECDRRQGGEQVPAVRSQDRGFLHGGKFPSDDYWESSPNATAASAVSRYRPYERNIRMVCIGLLSFVLVRGNLGTANSRWIMLRLATPVQPLLRVHSERDGRQGGEDITAIRTNDEETLHSGIPFLDPSPALTGRERLVPGT